MCVHSRVCAHLFVNCVLKQMCVVCEKGVSATTLVLPETSTTVHDMISAVGLILGCLLVSSMIHSCD